MKSTSISKQLAIRMRALLDLQATIVSNAKSQQLRGHNPKIVVAGYLANASKLDGGKRTVHHFEQEIFAMLEARRGTK